MWISLWWKSCFRISNFYFVIFLRKICIFLLVKFCDRYWSIKNFLTIIGGQFSLLLLYLSFIFWINNTYVVYSFINLLQIISFFLEIKLRLKPKAIFIFWFFSRRSLRFLCNYRPIRIPIWELIKSILLSIKILFVISTLFFIN